MAESQKVTRQTKDKPGHFVSIMDEYPGYIQFPYPLQLKQVGEWWKTAVEAIKDLTPLDLDFQLADWKAAKALLLTHGEWKIDGVSEMAVKNDDVPAIVMTFVVEAANTYIPPFLPLKARRRIQGLI